ncbi:hypothetical protein FB451DRAFT_1393968 [Mycena latifolia]|nr:hypothetical protein FB451DRAFT_1393968 [Mycena latifolia]
MAGQKKDPIKPPARQRKQTEKVKAAARSKKKKDYDESSEDSEDEAGTSSKVVLDVDSQSYPESCPEASSESGGSNLTAILDGFCLANRSRIVARITSKSFVSSALLLVALTHGALAIVCGDPPLRPCPTFAPCPPCASNEFCCLTLGSQYVLLLH